jgi:hypothetical protein
MPRKGWAACPNVDGDIEHAAAHDRYKLSLRLRVLDMKPSQHAASRAREVILKKRHFYPCDRVTLRLKGLEKTSSRISEDFGLDDDDFGDFSSDDFHDEFSHRSNFSKHLYLLCIDHPV